MPYYSTDRVCEACGAPVLKATGMCAFRVSGWCCRDCGHIPLAGTRRDPLLSALWEAVEILAEPAELQDS